MTDKSIRCSEADGEESCENEKENYLEFHFSRFVVVVDGDVFTEVVDAVIVVVIEVVVYNGDVDAVAIYGDVAIDVVCVVAL